MAADNSQVTDDPAGSGLSYSALENEGDSVEHRPASRRRYGPGSSSSGACGDLTRCLRASVPHVVLITAYIAFLLIGGAFYYLLERNINEIAQEAEKEIHSAEYFTMKSQIRAAIANMTARYGFDSTGNLTGLVDEFATMVEIPYLMYLHDARHQELSYTRSVVFCATTISTIGYGDSVPNTTGGKIMVAILSIVGIPLTLIVLADIGYFLAGSVRYLVNKFRNRWFQRAADVYSDGANEGLAPAIVAVGILLLFVLLWSGALALMEGWQYGDSLFFSFVTLSTIGFGDIVPVSHFDHVLSFVAILVFILFGLSIMSMCVVLLLPKCVGVVSRLADKLGF